MLGVRFLDVDFMRKTLPARLLLYRLYTFLEQFNQPSDRAWQALPVDPCWSRWTSGRHAHPATIVIAQFPCETRGWGDFWISKNWFGPCSKSLAENRFLN